MAASLGGRGVSVVVDVGVVGDVGVVLGDGAAGPATADIATARIDAATPWASPVADLHGVPIIASLPT
jgi:hypothetical protein